MIDVSIIIVNWNARKLLDKCLESIYNDKMDFKFEIIVVDNNSNDDSTTMIHKKYPGVTLIQNNENLGFSKANNIGIRQSKGRYISLVNSDIEIIPGCFKKLIEYMDKKQEIGMIGPKILNTDRTLQLSTTNYPNLWFSFCRLLALDSIFPSSKFFNPRSKIINTSNQIHDVEVLIGCFLVVRKTSLKTIGLLDERFYIYSEDIDWSKRFGNAGLRVVYYPEAQAIHHSGGSSKNAPYKFNKEYYKALFLYLKKYHNPLEVKIFYLFTLLDKFLRVFFMFFRLIIPSTYRQLNFLTQWKNDVKVLKWLIFKLSI